MGTFQPCPFKGLRFFPPLLSIYWKRLRMTELELLEFAFEIISWGVSLWVWISINQKDKSNGKKRKSKA